MNYKYKKPWKNRRGGDRCTRCHHVESGSMTEMRKCAVNGIECRVESLDSVELSIRITVDTGYSIPYARRREKRVSVGRQESAGRRGGGGSGKGGGNFSIMRISTSTMGPQCQLLPLSPRPASGIESRCTPPRNKQ